MTSLGGNVAIVTGAASAIGLATAKGLLDEGASLVLGDLDGIDKFFPGRSNAEVLDTVWKFFLDEPLYAVQLAVVLDGVALLNPECRGGAVAEERAAQQPGGCFAGREVV